MRCRLTGGIRKRCVLFLIMFTCRPTAFANGNLLFLTVLPVNYGLRLSNIFYGAVKEILQFFPGRHKNTSFFAVGRQFWHGVVEPRNYAVSHWPWARATNAASESRFSWAGNISCDRALAVARRCAGQPRVPAGQNMKTNGIEDKDSDFDKGQREKVCIGFPNIPVSHNFCGKNMP